MGLKEIFHESEDKDCVSSERRGKPAEIVKDEHHMAKAMERKYCFGNSILTSYEYCKAFAISSVILAVWMARKAVLLEG